MQQNKTPPSPCRPNPGGVTGQGGSSSSTLEPGQGRQWEHFPSLAPWLSSLPSTVPPSPASASPAPHPRTPLAPRSLCKQCPVTPQPCPSSPTQTGAAQLQDTDSAAAASAPLRGTSLRTQPCGHGLVRSGHPQPTTAPGTHPSATRPPRAARHREGAKPSLRHREQVAKTSVQTGMPEVGVSPGPTGTILPVLLLSPSDHAPPACPAHAAPGLMVFTEWPSTEPAKLGLSLLHGSKPPCCGSPGALHPSPAAHAAAADWHVFPPPRLTPAAQPSSR